jgi:aspartate racemase
MRGVFGETRPKTYPIILHITLPIKDFSSNKILAKQAKDQIVGVIKQHSLHAVDQVIIACNTAHILVEDIRAEVQIPICSLLTQTEREIRKRGLVTVGVIASSTSTRVGLHLFGGLHVILPNHEQQAKVEKIIHAIVNSGEISTKHHNAIKGLIAGLMKQGADAVVLGCSEIEMAMQDAFPSESLIRPLELAAIAVLREQL